MVKVQRLFAKTNLKIPVCKRLPKYVKKAGASSRFVPAFLMLLFYVRFPRENYFL